MRLIDADALKREQMKAFNCEDATKYGNKDAKQQERSYSTIMLYEVSDIIEDTIDNAPTIPLPDYKEGYRQAIADGKTNYPRPHGKWIYESRRHLDDETDDGPVYRVDTKCFCGVCGADFGYRRTNSDNFCKYCGADMRGGQGDDPN